MPAQSNSERRREQYRRAAEVQRRKKGIAPVKGLPVSCRVCGVSFVRLSHMAHSCPPCQNESRLRRARECAARKRATAGGREYNNNFQREMRKKSARFRVSSHVRSMMHAALGRGKQGRSWRNFVDYSLDELMLHLERQFTGGMSWNNQGEWHIDHIVPQSSFTFESPSDPGFKQCWALANLRPLWGRDNQRKGAKRTHLI